MEVTDITMEQRVWSDDRRVLSECWIYTPERGLKAVTMHGNGASIALDGRRLYRWRVMDEERGSIVAHVYCADEPTNELRDRVAQWARERFIARHLAPPGDERTLIAADC